MMKRKKALWKDFFVEIRKTYNKFLSLLLIVALGVAFYSGVRSTEPDMKQSADKLYDDSNFMDIKLMAPTGLTQAELDAVGKLEQVEQIHMQMQFQMFIRTILMKGFLQEREFMMLIFFILV